MEITEETAEEEEVVEEYTEESRQEGEIMEIRQVKEVKIVRKIREVNTVGGRLKESKDLEILLERDDREAFELGVLTDRLTKGGILDQRLQGISDVQKDDWYILFDQQSPTFYSTSACTSFRCCFNHSNCSSSIDVSFRNVYKMFLFALQFNSCVCRTKRRNLLACLETNWKY